MNQKGFTLIELLIVIAIIAILAGVVFVALDPLTRFQDARDSTRWQDVTAVLSAIKINQVDNRGYYLATIAATTPGLNYIVGTATSGCDSGCTAVTSTQATCVDLTGLVTDGYLGELPVDPNGGTSAKTLYYLSRSANGIVTVGSCVPENTTEVRVTR